MTAFSSNPIAYRIRPLEQDGTQQSAAARPKVPAGYAVQSIEEQPPAEAMLRPSEPMVRQSTPLDRTPSPFIKPEPKDTNAYSAFPVEIDEDEEYRPNQRLMSAATGNTNLTMYDPARPIARRSTRLNADRILTSKGEEMMEPPTVCFTAKYRNQQFVHVLKCHGPVETRKPQACGPNCATTTEGDKTLRNGWPIDCTNPTCAEARERRHAAVFMPKKRQRTATPAFIASQHAKASKMLGAGNAVRRSDRLNAYDQTVAGMNELVAKDEGHALLAEKLEGPGVRRKSKRHPGYAYTKEIHEDEAAQRLFDITGGLDLNLDQPTAKRELKKLQIHGTDKLAGIGGAFGMKRKAEDVAAEFAAHDKPSDSDSDKDRPWSYAHGAHGMMSAIRNANAGMYSIPETTYNGMVLEENGVVLEQEDNRTHRLPRNKVDDRDVSDDEDAPGGFQTVEACQVCEVAGDGQLQACTSCHQHFHPACAGIGEDSGDGNAAAEYVDNVHYICDGDGCNKTLASIRYKCYNVRCKDHDFCRDCYDQKSATHASEMAEKGDDPSDHGFIAVRGLFEESLRAAKNAAEYGFVCSGCKDIEYAQKLANQMFTKKTMNLAEIKGQVKASRKTKKEAMEKAGTAEAVRQRIADKKKSGISKPATPSKRRSNRIAGGSSLGSARASRFKLNLSQKQVADLVDANLTADSPEVIAAKAQLQPICEEDVTMTDGPNDGIGEGADLYDPTLFGVE